MTLLLAAALIFGLLGLIRWQAGRPAEESARLADTTPQYIGVFINQHSAALQVTALIDWSRNSATEDLYVRAGTDTDADVLVTSTGDGVTPFQNAGYPFYQVTIHGAPNGQRAGWALVTSTSRLIPSPGSPNPQYGALVGRFRLPAVVETPKHSVFADLPELEPQLAAVSPAAILGQADVYVTFADGHVQSVTENAAGYSSGISGLGSPDYWLPNPLTDTEVLEDFRPALSDDEVNSSFPDQGSFQGSNYYWQAQGTLQPELSATNIAASESEATDQFLAGIFFGIAASAALALVPLLAASHRRRRRTEPATVTGSSA